MARCSGTPQQGRRWPLLAIVSSMGMMLAVIAALFVAPGTARAEPAQIVSSQPSAGATLDTPPTHIVITFDQTIGSSVSARIVCNGNPQPAAPTSPSEDLKSLVVDLETVVLPRGQCDVNWAVIPASETVVSSGVLSFTIANDPAASTTTAPGTPATTATTTAPSTNDAGDGTSSTDLAGPLGLARLLSTLTLAMMLGAIVLIGVAWPEGVDYILTLRYIRLTWLAAVITTAVNVACLSAQATGASFTSSLIPTAWTDLTDTTPGIAALARMALTVMAGWVALRPDRINDPTTQLPAVAIPALAVATMGFNRSGGELELVGYAAGVFHALAMAVWFGGIVLLVRVVLAGPGEEDLVHAVRGFAKVAPSAIVITVITGAVQLYRLDRGHLTDSNHGRLLIVKLIPVIGMVLVGTATRQFIKTRLARDDVMTTPTAAQLRRAVGFEALFGVAALGLTSWMMSTQPPNLHANVRTASEYPAHVSLANAEGTLDVTLGLNPSRVGNNEMLLEVVEPASGITSILVSFTPPAAQTNATAVSVTFTELTGAGAIHIPRRVGVPLDQSGEWSVQVEVTLGNLTVLRQAGQITVTGSGSTPAVIPDVTSPPVTAAPTTTSSTVAASG